MHKPFNATTPLTIPALLRLSEVANADDDSGGEDAVAVEKVKIASGELDILKGKDAAM
jgi:hypothetical protein